MSYFFPIPVPFVPGIPMPPFHLNTYSSRPTTASAVKKSAPKRKAQPDTVEISNRGSTKGETPKAGKKLRLGQVFQWMASKTKRAKKETITSPERKTRSVEVLKRPTHPKDQPNENPIATASSFVVLSRPNKAKPQDEHIPPISSADAAIIAAAFRNILHQPTPEAMEGLVDDDAPADLTFHQQATDEMDEKTFKGMSDDDFSDTVRADVKARHAAHLQQVRVKPYQSPTSRKHSVVITENNQDAEDEQTRVIADS